MTEIVRGSVEDLDDLRPLWLALRTHHHEVAPELGPVRGDDETWAKRRGQYEKWLTTDARNLVLIAREDGGGGRAVGYAFGLVVDSDSATWASDGVQVLEVETLSVAPEARGGGVGKRLLQGLRDEVAARGYDRLALTVVAANRDALRFYEREGLTPEFVYLRDTRGTP